MVKTNKPNKMDFNSGGMTNIPNCPSTTATINVQAVAPMENPRMRIRPSSVPMAMARRRKTSGAPLTMGSTKDIDGPKPQGAAGTRSSRPYPSHYFASAFDASNACR